jgi:hypothetical protein
MTEWRGRSLRKIRVGLYTKISRRRAREKNNQKIRARPGQGKYVVGEKAHVLSG